MRFYLHRDRDSFEQFKDKAEIVEHLLTPPVSISLIESNYQQDNALGKRAAREIVQSTTTLIVVVILATTIVFVASHEMGIHPAWSVSIFVIYLLMIGFFKLIFGFEKVAPLVCWGFQERALHFEALRRKFIDKLNPSDKSGREVIHSFFDFESSPDFQSLPKRDKHRRRLAMLLASQKKRRFFGDLILTNVPFSLRNIWLWTLIIGLCSLYIKKDYQVIKGGNFNGVLFQDFMADFLRILLVAVVAYIATNVINELLQLREQYVQGKSEMASLNASIGKSTEDFEQIKDDAKELSERLSLMTETAEVQKALIDLWRKFSVSQNREPLDHIFKNFTDTIKEQFDIFNKKVTKNDVVDLWMLSSLNQYFKIASNEFKDYCWLATRFQFFGKIINATIDPILKNPTFLNDFKEKYEIFTVLVLPPERFFNYDDGKRSDDNWDEYIKINIEAKRAGLQINRHFLSLDFTEDDAMEMLVKKEFGDESSALKKSAFRTQLNTEYWFSDSPSTSSELIKKGKDKNNKSKYLRVGDGGDAPSVEGYTKRSLRYILNEIHCDNACKVIELKIPDEAKTDRDILNKFDDILWDRSTKKPLDYFAIKERNKEGNGIGKWVLCYRTVYDKTFDFAKIEILNEQSQSSDEWNKICDNLNQVFSIDISSDGGRTSGDEETGIKISLINTYS